MSKDFSIYVITSPDEVEDEAAKLTSLLKIGVDGIHLRKPNWTVREVKKIIEDIPYKYRKKLRLHGHFELLNEFNLAGVHLNSRNPSVPNNAASVSSSIHSIKELENLENMEYVTLSPIYDSISKPGYTSPFNLDILDLSPYRHKIVALGGINPSHFLLLKKKGFSGAALLGYIWIGDFKTKLSHLEISIKQLESI